MRKREFPFYTENDETFAGHRSVLGQLLTKINSVTNYKLQFTM